MAFCFAVILQSPAKQVIESKASLQIVRALRKADGVKDSLRPLQIGYKLE